MDGHILPHLLLLRSIAKSQYIRSLVCVEHEQHDFIKDSPVWNKLTYIVNGFDVQNFQLTKPLKKNKNLIVYLGALIPQKGFHMLAKVWPKIILKNPDARLVVIGTGKLYDEKDQLGYLKIAEKSYEDKYIIPYLCDEKKKIIPSVNFVGKLGHEKKELLYKASIGIVNPTGNTENCPGASLEFQACGTPIVTSVKYGLLDTVKHNKTGLLGRGANDLIQNILKLLDNHDQALLLGKNGPIFVSNRYNWRKVTDEWSSLLVKVNKGDKIIIKSMKHNYFHNYKIFIYINCFFQKIFGKIFFWPAVNELRSLVSKFYKKILKVLLIKN